MTSNSHRILGVVGLVVVQHYQPMYPAMLLAAGVVALVFSTLPDIDLKFHWHHRGWTHSWLWPVFLICAGWYRAVPLATVAGAALATHLLADMITGGIQAWPFDFQIGWHWFKVSSVWESLFMLALLGGIFYYLYPNTFENILLSVDNLYKVVIMR